MGKSTEQTSCGNSSCSTASPASSSIIASASATLISDRGTFKLNANYLAELDIAWAKLTTHPLFQGIATLSIPPVSMQGLDLTKLQEDINNHGTYTCGGNLFWADPVYTGTPGAPRTRPGSLA